ncbi:MAG: GNAT family N-acetyltransferase [Propioniciclava sp.]
MLLEATLLNINWADPRFTPQDVRATHEFAHYTELLPERGDFGFVASGAAGWGGAVWVVYLPATDPGYGFVAPGVGELRLSVRAEFRSAGLGRELLSIALEATRRRGDAAVSLSVEEGNPARRLYESVGFVDVDPFRRPGTMMLDLGRVALGARAT